MADFIKSSYIEKKTLGKLQNDLIIILFIEAHYKTQYRNSEVTQRQVKWNHDYRRQKRQKKIKMNNRAIQSKKKKKYQQITFM